jgi:RHS repeat-associated protein
VTNGATTLTTTTGYDTNANDRRLKSIAHSGVGRSYSITSKPYQITKIVDTPSVGRWMSRDPIREKGGINLYGYVGGSPTMGVDPSGLEGLEVPLPNIWEAGAAAVGGLGIWWNNNVAPYIFPTNSSPVPNSTPSPTPGPSPTASPTASPARIPKPQSTNNPFPGTPGSEVTCDSPKGGLKQTRRYGPDGYPETDTDWDHDHGQGKPHVHDWGRPGPNTKPTQADRGPGRAPRPGDPGFP